ncbi:MAG: phosphoglucosamine mutase [Coriobacteriales bacterium]|nr:phosphoglucosamine mutase [Coriobacteriales bacterium]
MGKYFGTDGFRGEAGVALTVEHAFKIGRILGKLACEKAADGRGAIVIGRDTRRSGCMLEQALAAGITASGSDAYLLGVITTPGVAFVTRSNLVDFDFGVMISASHNPYQDNGIKVLNNNGEKLEAAVEKTIEDFLDAKTDELPHMKGAAIGVTVPYSHATREYAEFLVSLAAEPAGATAAAPFAGCKVALDCANGSASGWAEYIYRKLGANVQVLSAEPDGLNINVNCGSTHMGALQQFVVDKGCDLGFAFDGDADRCLAVDAAGNVVNGDQLMYLSAIHMKETGRLTSNTVVATVMSNIGLFKALDAAGIGHRATKVGDKYVYECMANEDHMIGGEQSGHIIFREFATTGDGMLTSIQIMKAVIASGKSLTELAAPMRMFPQVLKNVRVDSKEGTMADPDVQAAIAAADAALEGDGRTLVRPSGTELLIRVMAEASTHEACEEQVDAIIAVMKEKGHVIA